MSMTAEVINIAAFLERKKRPERVFRREMSQNWQTLSEPLDLAVAGGNPQWAYVRMGDFVRVELTPYQINGDNPMLVVPAVIAIVGSVLPYLDNPGRVHWIVGDPLEQTGPTTFRLWLGLAVQCKE